MEVQDAGSARAKLVGFFPGLGSRDAYRGAAEVILNGATPRTLALVDEAASALREPATRAELLLDGVLPTDRLRRQGRIGAGLLAANLALARRFEDLAATRGVRCSFTGFTGESFGVLSAAVASGALTVGDGVRIAEAFTPLMLLASASDAGAADDQDEFLEELLAANGVDTPATAWATDDASVLDAISIAETLRSALRELRSPGTPMATHHLGLLREVFNGPASPLQLIWVRRLIGDAITDLVSRPRRDDLSGLCRFLDLFQCTLAHREDIDVADGSLVARARVKKRLNGEASTLGHAATELEVLHPDGRIELVSLDGPGHAESLVFHFENPPNTRADEIVKAARGLARAQPAADRIRADLVPVGQRLRMTGWGLVSVQAAVGFVVHRLALFELLRIHRPALAVQTDPNLAGTDRAGWLVSLAAAQATTPASIVPLVALSFDHEPDPDRLNAALDRFLPEIGDAAMSVLSPDGVPLGTRRELQDATVRVFRNAALDRPERLVQVNGACLVVSLGSVLASYRLRSTPHQAQVVSVRVPAELWRKGLNRALDAADERAALGRSHEREHVLGYAQHRKILSSTVNAYIEPGETVVGFGAGGSESMTMFFERDAAPGIRVRKVLSEALTTVSWDPSGTGVMLPPFTKAQRQAEYLQALPPSLGRLFPQVGTITARELPVPTYLAAGRSGAFRELIYEMSYVPGEEISRWVERTSPPSAVVARVYEVILEVLHRDVHAVRRRPAPGATLEEQYFTKIEQRLNLCRRTAPATFGPWLLEPDRIVINGRALRNIRPLLAAFRSNPGFQAVLEPRFHALVMGDTNTENIKVVNLEPLHTAQRVVESGARPADVDAALRAITAESIGVMFLDPRAIGYRSEGADTRDDPMYDNKPWHNSIGHYDEMHYEEFQLDTGIVNGAPTVDIRFRAGNPYQRAYDVRDVLEREERVTDQTGMEAHFARVMRSVYDLDDPNAAQHRDDPHWLTRFVFTMGTHFAAMPPFHFLAEVDGSLTDTPLTQRRPVAIYAEGIKWLNWSLEMLEGTRLEFLGLPVVPANGETAVVDQKPRNVGTGGLCS
ncbi:ACP S-malonyltransferase [Patulibacter sp. NPDC049589]|uniref:ACP S-malonyltransferase n=1 Tax=Patulibacter sp. NPDC049589 TaxID=3154731 RepID=UPI00343719DA